MMSTGFGKLPVTNAANAAFVAAVAQAPVVHPRLNSFCGFALEFTMTNFYKPCR
jgi:hypothetical protein